MEITPLRSKIVFKGIGIDALCAARKQPVGTRNCRCTWQPILNQPYFLAVAVISM